MAHFWKYTKAEGNLDDRRAPAAGYDARTGTLVPSHQMAHGHDNLALANRHIADAMRLIADQRACIEMLRRDGHGTVGAEKLLALFETSLALMIEHRDLILRDLRR